MAATEGRKGENNPRVTKEAYTARHSCAHYTRPSTLLRWSRTLAQPFGVILQNRLDLANVIRRHPLGRLFEHVDEMSDLERFHWEADIASRAEAGRHRRALRVDKGDPGVSLNRQ